MKNYPKVLIINEQSFDINNATGITLRSIWEKWPDSNVLEVCIDCADTTSRPAVKRIQARGGLLRRLTDNATAKKVNSSMKSSSDDSGTKESLKKWIRQLIVSCIISTRASLSSGQLKELEKFDPDVIYTLGANVTILKLVHELSGRFDVPVVLHFMDNWVEHSPWEDNILLLPYRRSLRKWLDKCLNRANIAIAISESMAKHFEIILHKKCAVLMNSINVEEHHCQPITRRDAFRFVYAGGLHLNRAESLKTLARVINNNSNDELHVYAYGAEQYKEDFYGLPVKLFSAVPHEEVKSIFEQADALVHIETMNPTILGFFRYSISTKIPEYLSSGRPVLFYGPKEMGLYEYLEKNDAAICVSEKAQLTEALKRIHDDSVTEGICRRAYQLALKNHQKSKAQDTLYQIISESIGR